MGYKEYPHYFERWLITNSNGQFISITDLKYMKCYVFQGEDSDEILERYYIDSHEDFLNWFYKHELDHVSDHKNYSLTEQDKEYIKSIDSLDWNLF